jgi:hypothetical protein
MPGNLSTIFAFALFNQITKNSLHIGCLNPVPPGSDLFNIQNVLLHENKMKVGER